MLDRTVINYSHHCIKPYVDVSLNSSVRGRLVGRRYGVGHLHASIDVPCEGKHR